MQHVLVSTVVGLLVGHPAAALHSYGVTAAKVVLHLGAVTAAFVVTTLEVPVFVEDNLTNRFYNQSIMCALFIKFTMHRGFSVRKMFYKNPLCILKQLLENTFEIHKLKGLRKNTEMIYPKQKVE